MWIDDTIIQLYLRGDPPETYSNHWIYSALGRGDVFTAPDPACREWVARLCAKLKAQTASFTPRNGETVCALYPNFDRVADSYTVLFTVGFPDPYDAMVLTQEGRHYMVFDLIQFCMEALDDSYSCHRVLTHELIHLCQYARWTPPTNATYEEELSYVSFIEGFAHALTYPENLEKFRFDTFHAEAYLRAQARLKTALAETDPVRRAACRIAADTGEYWDKFASISGKLYLLRHRDRLYEIHEAGWQGFAEKIIHDRKEGDGAL